MFNHAAALELYQESVARHGDVLVGVQEATESVREMIKAKELDWRSMDLGKLFAECYGWDQYRNVCTGRTHYADVLLRAQVEADGAVQSAAFLNLASQF